MPQNSGDTNVGSNRRTRSDNQDADRVLAIIERIQAGDESAFEELVKLYRTQVASIAYKIVGDYDDAKDITQMVFVKLYHNLQRYDPSKRFTTWLYRIATNAAIDFVRKFKKQKFELLEETWGVSESPEASPADQFALKMLKEYVLKSADRLNYKQRMAFVLRDVDGLDIAEVARIMDMPQATVRWYLHRARARLRSDIRRRYPHLLSQLGLEFLGPSGT
jgi:RNA polymerase sigma-70 factor (ECF subfamily)